MTAPRRSALPPSLPPRGLDRAEAAAYVGVSPGTFDAMVAAGDMPTPKAVGRRLVWDRLAVDRAFEALPERGADTATVPHDEAADIWSRVRA